jgi:Xaa-Pro dipeptidase
MPKDLSIGVESVCPIEIYDEILGSPLKIDLIDDLRMIKSEYETQRIAYSSKIASNAHKNLLLNARVGQTLREVSSTVSNEMMKDILIDEPSTNMYATRLTVLFQNHNVSYDPHNFTDISLSMQKGGPHISIINAVINGYGTEIERTFFLGSVPDEAKKPFETMMEARKLALKLCVPGNLMSDVDKCVNDVFRKAGYGDNMLHRTGHSIGVTGHEAPFLAEGYDHIIQPGMFFTIEPGIYLPEVGGFRHSDVILITEDGNKLFTDDVVDLEDLIIPIINND